LSICIMVLLDLCPHQTDFDRAILRAGRLRRSVYGFIKVLAVEEKVSSYLLVYNTVHDRRVRITA
jgi:hypothetical protein